MVIQLKWKRVRLGSRLRSKYNESCNPVVTRAARTSRTNRIIEVICPLAFLLSPDQSGRWLVGAVGIENNNGRDFKDLRGIRGNAKLLKNSTRECKRILIAPSKRPRFLSSNRI